MLLRCFPSFFERIPWQKTGFPISWTTVLEKKYAHVIRNLRNLKYTNYVNYSNWIRLEPAKSLFQEKLVDNKDALYRNFISGDIVENEWYMHINNKKQYSINLSRYLTIEIWLQQVYNSKFEWN
jgi:asparagine synthase (glutamine-hydrolysing)